MNPVLYQDELILIANKPAGIPIHETKDPSRLDFTRQLQETLKLPYLRTANRLDLNTTGIVVFGLDPARNKDVDEILVDSYKFYLAKVHGIIKDSQFRIETFLKDGNKRVQTVRSGGRKAITECKVIERNIRANTSLVEAELITGRRHQIRIHLSEFGYPILGDEVYGKTKDDGLKRRPLDRNFSERKEFSQNTNLHLNNKINNSILHLHSYKLILNGKFYSNLIIECSPDW